jgi:hypothetical protein
VASPDSALLMRLVIDWLQAATHHSYPSKAGLIISGNITPPLCMTGDVRPFFNVLYNTITPQALYTYFFQPKNKDTSDIMSLDADESFRALKTALST